MDTAAGRPCAFCPWLGFKWIKAVLYDYLGLAEPDLCRARVRIKWIASFICWRIVKTKKKERCLIVTLVECVKKKKRFLPFQIWCRINYEKQAGWKTDLFSIDFVVVVFIHHVGFAEEGRLDGYGLKMEKTLYQEGEKRKGKERGKEKKHFQEWVCRSRQRVLFPDSWGLTEHRGRGKGTLSKREENSWSWHQPSSFSLYLLKAEL